MLVHLHSAKIDYEFELFDKITYVSNESCLSSDVLLKMIKHSYDEPEAVHCESDLMCVDDIRRYGLPLKTLLQREEPEIVFINNFSEYYDYEEFLDTIKDSDHYFVIFARDLSPNFRRMVVDEEKTTDKKVYITII